MGTVKRANPSAEDAKSYHSDMIESSLARGTVNARGAAFKAFYKMQGTNLELPYLKVSNKIPYYFSEEEVLAIFNACTNLKHYAMLSLTFYCMLRVSDLSNLEDSDIDLKSLSLRIRDGKFGKSAILPIPPDCAQVMESYLQVRPKIQIDNKYLLFYTDRLNKWPRRSVEQMFKYYKKRAGVSTPGSTHVFRRVKLDGAYGYGGSIICAALWSGFLGGNIVALAICGNIDVAVKVSPVDFGTSIFQSAQGLRSRVAVVVAFTYLYNAHSWRDRLQESRTGAGSAAVVADIELSTVDRMLILMVRLYIYIL